MQEVKIQKPDAAEIEAAVTATEAKNVLPVVAADAKNGIDPLVASAKAMNVTTQSEHETALLAMKDIAAAQKRVQDIFAKPKSAAHATHRSICDEESKLLAPLGEARRILNGKCDAYEREEKRKADELQRQLDEKARKEAEDRQLLDAIEAEERGEGQLAEEILSEPAPPPPALTVLPRVAKVAGVSARETWSAVVTNKLDLVKYVAAHPEWIGLLDPNMPALNGLARSQRAALAIPGVEAKRETSRAVSSR